MVDFLRRHIALVVQNTGTSTTMMERFSRERLTILSTLLSV